MFKRLILMTLLFAAFATAQDPFPVWEKLFPHNSNSAWSSSNQYWDLWGVVDLAVDITNYEATYNSAWIYLRNENSGAWNGFIAFTLQVDSVAADSVDTSPDTLTFYPVYDLGIGFDPFVGDTLTWTYASDDISASTTTKIISPQSTHGKVYYWSSEYYFDLDQGIYDHVPLKRMYVRCIATGDTVGAHVKMNYFRY